jgi:hypothetical protein
MAPDPRSLAVNPDVVCSPLAEGGVLFNLSTKQYFAVNPTGLLVWQYFEEGGGIDQLVQRLVDRYPGGSDPAAFGVREFAARLVGLGLADAADGGSNPRADGLSLPPAWMTPEVTPHGQPLSKVILSPFDPTVPIPE